MERKLVWICMALIVSASSLAYGTKRIDPYDPNEPEPPFADSEWEENLGSGVLGQLAYAVDQGRGMELAREWGFEADREIKVSSIVDLGEFARYAPSGINKLGWSGTAYIQGSFDGNAGNMQFKPGIFVYQLDSGQVIWIHATGAWLDRLEHSGVWLLQGEELSYGDVGEEIRVVIPMNLSPGEDMMVYGLGSFGMHGTVGSVHLRLVYPFQRDGSYPINRYDIWLKRSRVKEMQDE